MTTDLTDFDKIIPRRGSGAFKYDALGDRFGNPDLTPLWVADMDFATPDFILDALRQRLNHPILGYTVEPADFRPAITDWQKSHHNWEVKPEWISYIPGIVKGIGLAMLALTKPGDGILITPPVYHPFRIVTELNGRVKVDAPLREADKRYELDFEAIERAIAEARDNGHPVKMMILSNPHNPGGTVWSRMELKQLAALASREKFIVISDEIHADMTFPGHSHTPFATVSEEAAANSVTFCAPSKVFNIPGVVVSYSIVPDETIRKKFHSFLEASELNAPGLFPPVALIAAYRQGEEWRKKMLEYVWGNVEAVERFIADNIPGISVWKPEASFLVWLDCRSAGLSHAELTHVLQDMARLALNDGEVFGTEGTLFFRLNVGAPRKIVMEAMHRLADAFSRFRSRSAT